MNILEQIRKEIKAEVKKDIVVPATIESVEDYIFIERRWGSLMSTMIETFPYLTRSQLVEITGMSRSYAHRLIGQLVDRGILGKYKYKNTTILYPLKAAIDWYTKKADGRAFRRPSKEKLLSSVTRAEFFLQSGGKFLLSSSAEHLKPYIRPNRDELIAELKKVESELEALTSDGDYLIACQRFAQFKGVIQTLKQVQELNQPIVQKKALSGKEVVINEKEMEETDQKLTGWIKKATKENERLSKQKVELRQVFIDKMIDLTKQREDLLEKVVLNQKKIPFFKFDYFRTLLTETIRKMPERELRKEELGPNPLYGDGLLNFKNVYTEDEEAKLVIKDHDMQIRLNKLHHVFEHLEQIYKSHLLLFECEEDEVTMMNVVLLNSTKKGIDKRLKHLFSIFTGLMKGFERTKHKKLTFVVVTENGDLHDRAKIELKELTPPAGIEIDFMLLNTKVDRYFNENIAPDIHVDVSEALKELNH